MKVKPFPLQKTWAVISALILLFTLTGSASATPAAPANGGMISGYVSSPGGYPLPVGTLVKLFDADGATTRGQALPDADTGAFQFGPVANGLYILKAVPPEASGYTQSLPKPASMANAPVNVGELALTDPQVSGTVFAPDGVTPAEADVLVLLGNGQVFQHINAPTGVYQIGGLPTGGYGLQAIPTGDDPYWRSPLTLVSVTEGDPLQTVNLTLAPAQIWGYTHDSLGQPLAYAHIFADSASGERSRDQSNANGFWAIGGLVDGDYTLSALPPWNVGSLLPPEPQLFSLPGAVNPYTLVFHPAPKTVQGMVLTNTSLPVQDALVIARRVNAPGSVEALTAEDGAYSLGLTPGLWALTVQHTPDSDPAAWIYPDAPQLVYFNFTTDPEMKPQDFTVLTADALASGVVQMPDGTTPPFTVTVGLYNDEGVGRRTAIDLADGSFELQLPNGSYKVSIHPQDPAYLGPLVDPVSLPENGSTDLGILKLLPRDALISGIVTSDSQPVAGIPLVAWRPGAPGNLHTTTGPDGAYTLAVSSGQWHIQPAPLADQPYMYTGAGQEIELTAGQSVADIDFSLLAADATISGSLVTEAGQPAVDAQGWAAAWQAGSPEIHNGAPVENGLFTIHVPAGQYHLMAHLPAGSPYLSTAEHLVSLAAGETLEVSLTVKTVNAHIQGALWDPRNADIVEGVAGIVGAWTQGAWSAAPINTDNGAYHLPAADGLWRLNFQIDPRSGYAKASGPLNIPLVAGQSATVPLRILAKDSLIRGSVLAPDGTPLAGATVIARGVGDAVDDLWLQTTSRADGSFELAVPYGRYRLGAAAGQPDWIKPAEYHVLVAPNSVSEGHILQFRLSDITLSGVVTIPGATLDGFVHVWAWAEDGGFVQKRFPVTSDGVQATGTYQLDILSNLGWHVGAAYETVSQFWATRVQLDPATGDVSLDLTLDGPYPKPAPEVVTFDASQPEHVRLADGTFIYIPAGAMPVSGLVTLRIVPLAILPNQQHANVLRYGYAFLATDASGDPIEAHFNQDVVISFTYSEADLYRLHILELLIKPAYYSTTTNRWTFPDSYVVDTDANRVTLQIDHFTDYALTGTGGGMTYLPMMVH
jgi:hypothetical protein